MKWLLGIVLGVLVGTVAVTTVGSFVSDGDEAASPTSSAAPLVSTSTTTVAPPGRGVSRFEGTANDER